MALHLTHDGRPHTAPDRTGMPRPFDRIERLCAALVKARAHFQTELAEIAAVPDAGRKEWLRPIRALLAEIDEALK